MQSCTRPKVYRKNRGSFWSAARGNALAADLAILQHVATWILQLHAAEHSRTASVASDYTSPSDNRWVLKDYFYVYSIEDKDSGTCYQCYGYAEGSDKKCKNVARGDKLCCGGDADMYDACFAKFKEWSDDSRKQLAKEDSGIQLWMNGHTHGESHDYSSTYKVHFMDNGAGGGIQKVSASGIPEYASADVEAVWTYGGQEYGFMYVEASEEWLKLQYHTADDSWSFAESFKSTTKGGMATKHCWYIPVDGGTGKEC
ncbi:hypothetical protein PF003_g18386 [Phytophthora fragariae]|nr:hypothetical protein PF003_g18386 [Phytophthora fragariae]